MTTEFMRYDADYYKEAIKEGRITINSHPCGIHTILNGHDHITHKVYREEPWIGDISEIKYDYLDEFVKTEVPSDLVAVYKPPNIPVHPTGSYSKNTLVHILKEQGLSLSPLHRLDRLTSGLMLMSSQPKKYQYLFPDQVQKHYYCLVQGEITWTNKTVDRPIAPYSKKRGWYTLSDLGKPSITHFTKIHSQNGNTLLEARPLTGRTHQIRLHCVALGHPIVNDPLYQHGLPNDTIDVSRSSEPIEEFLYLHAYKYIINKHTLLCPHTPKWAQP